VEFHKDYAGGNNTGNILGSIFSVTYKKPPKWTRRFAVELFAKLLILNGCRRGDRTAEAGPVDVAKLEVKGDLTGTNVREALNGHILA
jgi:hypothetical protein